MMIARDFQIISKLEDTRFYVGGFKFAPFLGFFFGVRSIEIINNTREGIVIFFTENKREHFFGGQIQVPDAGPGTYWQS